MIEETPSGEEIITVEVSGVPELPEKCTRQNVLTVVLKPKCLSNLTLRDLFTAGIVFLNTERPEKTADTKFFAY
jgi:hypothetical protein